MRRLLLRLVTAAPGGPGTPPGRHYDRSAGSRLDWDRLTLSNPQAGQVSGSADLGTEIAAMERRPARVSPLRDSPPQGGIQDVALTGAPSPSARPKGEKDRRTRRLTKNAGDFARLFDHPKHN